MQSGAFLHILHRQGLSMFQTIDTFMFCPVILVQPSDILQKTDQRDISQENTDANHTLQQNNDCGIGDQFFEKRGKKIGQHDEDPDRQRKGNNHNQSVHKFFLALTHLRLLLILIKGSGEIQALHAQPQRIHEVEHTSDKRDPGKPLHQLRILVLLLQKFNLSVRFPHSNSVLLAVLHHDSFQNGLTADTGVYLFSPAITFISQFTSHSFISPHPSGDTLKKG